MEICGTCQKEFSTGDNYLTHTCVTGYKPTEMQHLGETFVLQSKEALKRTGSLDKKAEAELEEVRQEVKDENVDHKLMLAKHDRIDEI